MSEGVPARAVWWEALGEAERAKAAPLLAPEAWSVRLEELVAAGRSAWPDVALDGGELVRFLAQRIPVDALASAPAAELRLGELYLACACARGDGVAIAALDKIYLAGMEAVLISIGLGADVAREAAQRTRVRLLVAENGAGARIAEYRGRGELRAWIRTAAVREALQLLRAHRREELAPPQKLESELVGFDPELQLLRSKYEDGFKRAFLDAFAELSPRERNILRQHLAFGMSCEQIGAIYSVHATTVLRWSNKARAALWKKTRRAVQRSFALDAGDAESVMRALQERLHITWERLMSKS